MPHIAATFERIRDGRDSCLCLSIVQIGGTYAKAILLPNEVAIGAIGRIQVISIILLLFVSDTAFNFL